MASFRSSFCFFAFSLSRGIFSSSFLSHDFILSFCIASFRRSFRMVSFRLFPWPFRRKKDEKTVWHKPATISSTCVSICYSIFFYIAGDYVKFNFPMAVSTSFLTWGLNQWAPAYVISGQYNYMLDSIKWPLDYFLKCWRNTLLYVQVWILSYFLP